ncbi:MAG: histidine--tRNA ligase [Flavobacteriales bacterium]|nr:histidine--tRNA ligase [Flavobacteriales bacterium]
MSKPSIPKGTRDFGPQVMARRNWMFGIMREVFERHGFQPIETPAMENLSTLTGKYGEEGDQLIFRILNNGDFLSKVDGQAWAEKDSKRVVSSISKKALRYDLTVPFARFVVMSRNELQFPFRRYQMQTVWRGDRPGKGRYQEFTQCDADIIGSESPLCELDLMLLFDEALSELGVPGFRIVINDRRLLNGLARQWGVMSQLQDLTIALDKWDKVGTEGVKNELENRGFGSEILLQVEQLFGLLKDPVNDERLKGLKSMLNPDDLEAQDAWREIAELIDRASLCGVPIDHVVFDPTLARGLDYYTGVIFEVRVDDSPVGSICGGGRYADLTGVFGWPDTSGVGISFGADRIYDVLEHFQCFPPESKGGSQLLILQMDEDGVEDALQLLQSARQSGIRSELYPDVAKLKKQMKHASDLGVAFVAMRGESERESGGWTLRNMESGEQSTVSAEQLVQRLG